MEHYDTYKTRRVQVRQPVIDGINNAARTRAARKGKYLADARLYALRELMLMEVPDRWSDVLLNAVPADPTGLNDARYPFYQDMHGNSPTGRTSLANIYLRRYAAIANRNNSLTGKPQHARGDPDNQGAECLYMVITLATGDGEARALFGESNIGDTDGDGALGVPRRLGAADRFPALGAGLRFADSDQREPVGAAPPTPSEHGLDDGREQRS